MSKNLEGSLIVISTEDGRGVAKVIFHSAYFADTICLKLFRKKLPDSKDINRHDFSGDFDLYYTSVEGFNKNRWAVFAGEEVSSDEKGLTKRTSGGDVWVQDVHLGTASEGDLAILPKMLVHGFKLVEKYVGRYPLEALA